MSYARYGDDSDVYVYETEGGIRCEYPCGFMADDASEMADHLRGHLSKGDKVPARALNALDDDVCQSLACKAQFFGQERPQHGRGRCGKWLEAKP